MNAQEELTSRRSHLKKVIHSHKKDAQKYLEKGNVDSAIDTLDLVQLFRYQLTAIEDLGVRMGLKLE